MDKFIQKFKKNFFQDNPALKNRIDKVKEKGHTRLTILLIPHGYDSSFNFQISIFTIFFFFLLLMSLISLSIYGIYKSSHTRREINNLQSIYGRYFNDYIESKNYLEEIEDDYSVIEANLNNIFLAFDGQNEELYKLPNEEELKRNSFMEIQDEEKSDPLLMEGRRYLNEVYDLRYLKHSMISNKRLLDANFDYFENRNSVMENLPIYNPMPYWKTTSPFGMRKSPTSGFYEFHDGTDMANAPGTPIYAAAPGRVIRVLYSNTGYGYHIVMEHEYGYKTLYAHCSRIYVKHGQFVEQGKKIAEVGATGNVTGPHLHYEIWIGDGNKTDPEEYLNAYSF
ncbi:MAG: M23 family metallopeptidase [Leptospira sp.]|nr:M23 family metallopeptidase [Leptospira sp.]